MPTYDYECDNCEHAFELFQQITASVKRKCPECGTLSSDSSECVTPNTPMTETEDPPLQAKRSDENS